MRVKPISFVWLVPMGMLILALAPWPYAYYPLLRLVVSVACAYLAFRSKPLETGFWVWILGATAVLYNPLLPMHLNRPVWSVLNIATIALLAAHWWKCGSKVL